MFQRGYRDDTADAPRAREPDELPARNPWLAVLWVIGILFTVAGIAGVWWSQQAFATPNTSSALDYYVLPAVVQALAPWFAGVGLVTIAGVVFLHAIRWQEARR